MINRSMLLNGVSALALLAGASLCVSPAAAVTITFDDLTDTSNGNGGTQIPNGYQGLNWSNWYVLNGPDYTSLYGPNGINNDTAASPNLAFNRFGTAADFSSTSIFTFDSADFTAFWNNNLSVQVTGKLNGTVEDSVTFSAQTTGPITEIFNWSGINEVYLNSSGGASAGYGSSNTQVALNNLVITPTPEPASIAILGAGLAGLGIARRRRKAPQS